MLVIAILFMNPRRLSLKTIEKIDGEKYFIAKTNLQNEIAVVFSSRFGRSELYTQRFVEIDEDSIIADEIEFAYVTMNSDMKQLLAVVYSTLKEIAVARDKIFYVGLIKDWSFIVVTEYQ